MPASNPKWNQALGGVMNQFTFGPTQLIGLWEKAKAVPGGKAFFSKLVGQIAPYSGSIPFEVKDLAPGRCEVELKDQRKVRNHLNSIHAIALINCAELSSGLATLAGISSESRGILKGFEIDYIKKARGPITAKCRYVVPEGKQKQEVDVPVELFDQNEEIVAKAKAKWLIGPKKDSVNEDAAIRASGE
jgi:acyl-coenzyme A thioesterase PaaI-like protein